MNIAERVVLAAEGWLGTPYHHHAGVKGHGVDCIQLLIKVYEEAGVVANADPGAYATDWHISRSEELYLNGLMRYALEETDSPSAGDVAVFRFGRCYSHGGIMSSADEVIHSYIRLGGVIRTRLHEAPLAGRPVKFFKLPTVPIT